MKYTYNENNELTQKINTDTGLKYVYGENNSVSVYKTSDNTLVHSYTESVTEADEENNIEAKTEVAETHFDTTYSSTIKNNFVSYTTGNDTVKYSYTENTDNIESDTIKFNSNTAVRADYEYDSNNNITSKALSFNAAAVSVQNAYDNENRISTTGYDEPLIYYTYDNNGQIIRSDNNFLNYSSTFTYDDRGNILSKNKYKYTRNENISSNPTETTTFIYSNNGWKDQLIRVNNDELTYDANGNVLTYGDKKYTWSSGRNLAQITDGDNTYSFAYDESGIRTSKTINNITTYYNTKDGVILSQTDGTNTMYFQYDTSGTPIGFILNDVQYLYLTNQMGDVISITDAQGNELVQYEYDEWGAVELIYTPHNSETENTLANTNPLRYRGYYYDNETGYYYLQSRYYDASICRFINADDYTYIDKDTYMGMNIFAYCGNNPVNCSDPEGYCYFVKTKGGRSWTHDNWEFVKTNTDFYRINNPTIVYRYNVKGQLDVDTDGAKRKLGSKYYQPKTSLKISNKFIDAEHINYIVYTDSKYKGCIAAIKNNKTGKIIYAIVADYATDKNEFSYAAVNNICPRGKNKKGKKLYWDGSNGPENVNISVTIFKKSKNDISKYFSNSSLSKQINGYGKKYLNLYNYYK